MPADKPLLVRDIIHGDMYFDHPLELVIDHELFQRLKFIVQNGICYQVFPGMTHTRFQHSLGVCHLALNWFDNLITKSAATDFIVNMAKINNPTISDGYEISLKDTSDCYKFIEEDKTIWKFLVGLAALTHDLGHGPFSHLLEDAKFIPADQFVSDASNLFPGKLHFILTSYINDRYNIKKIDRVDHEDITLVYLSVIFSELKGKHPYFSEDNFEIVSALISKEFKHFMLEEYKVKKYSKSTQQAINLLISLTSGFIDADRLDYVIRDSQMAGVNIGAIEVYKITDSLFPCLFSKGSNYKSGFVANFKHNHILDSFFFSLYQVYTQVIFHPKALQLNHELTEIFKVYKTYLSKEKASQNYLEWHKGNNDLLFIAELGANNFDPNKLINKVLNRHEDYKNNTNFKNIYGLPSCVILPSILDEKKYTSLNTKKRDMIKDSSLVWLFTKIEKEYQIYSWEKNSIVCQNLKNHSFKPNIFWKNEAFEKDLEKLKVSLQDIHEEENKKANGTNDR
ncbi:MAG: hypothetical protein L6Q33_00430 [Bacteriovoracaceae bacterium]|nr:hypothetical protein [Bacteriovoracaceae bacterium]